ncbi:hypothetical protein [Chelativorans sp.]|uniref:hypothetical protein n=1 Tax=Chelativorans sp. TaxID=2203393 RepID=UPI0028110250|nr:hypothetical protein [Chelativorans sp.]
MIADYIDEFIMLCVGLWMTGVGFGFLSVPTNPGRPAWQTHLIRQFKWMGPLLLIIAVVLAIATRS